MILDHLANASIYAHLHPRLEPAFKFLQSQDLKTIPEGKHLIDGENVFAIIQEYLTKPRLQGFWESHRRYIDVQYVVAGAENIGFAPISRMTPAEHDVDKDLLKHSGSGQFFRLNEGFFMILFPHDVHMPCINIGKPKKVRKIVVKVKV